VPRLVIRRHFDTTADASSGVFNPAVRRSAVLRHCPPFLSPARSELFTSLCRGKSGSPVSGRVVEAPSLDQWCCPVSFPAGPNPLGVATVYSRAGSNRGNESPRRQLVASAAQGRSWQEPSAIAGRRLPRWLDGSAAVRGKPVRCTRNTTSRTHQSDLERPNRLDLRAPRTWPSAPPLLGL
jgi:hypothetical protein